MNREPTEVQNNHDLRHPHVPLRGILLDKSQYIEHTKERVIGKVNQSLVTEEKRKGKPTVEGKERQSRDKSS